MSRRAVPFYCPFCGEQDLRPDEAGAAVWRCESCERRFELAFVGVGEAPAEALQQRRGRAPGEALKERSGSAPGGDA